MKKLIVSALLGLAALTATPADAGVRFGITIGSGQVYSHPCGYTNTYVYDRYTNTCRYRGYGGYSNSYRYGYTNQNQYGYQNQYTNSYDYGRAQRDYDRQVREYQHQLYHQQHDDNDDSD